MTKTEQSNETASKKSVQISAKHSPIQKRWRDLSSLEKLRAATRAAMAMGGHAVTVNLSPDLERILKPHPDPIRFLEKRVNKELTKAGMQGLPLLLALEATRTSTSRLHLHGLLIPENFPMHAVQAAMRKAAGFVCGRAGSRQFKAERLYDSDGWTNYIIRDFSITRKALQISVSRDLWWISHSMTKTAKAHHTSGFSSPAANLATSPSYRAS